MAHQCLSDVLDKNIPFKLAIDKASKKKGAFPEERSKLTGIVGCSLRHFYIFENIIDRLNIEFSLDRQIGLLLYLSNTLFVSTVNDEVMNKYLRSVQISKEIIDSFQEHIQDKTKLIPQEFSPDSVEYLHFRYNIPEWALKMWLKHFKGYTYKIVKSLNKISNHYAIMDNRQINEETLLSHKDFEKTEFDSLYKYNGKVSQSHYSLYKEGKIAGISPAEFYLLNKLDLDVVRPIAFYTEKHNNLHLQLMCKLSKSYHMEVIAGEDESYYPIKKDIETYSLNNVNVYQAKHSSIITCLSEKVSNFFVLPGNSYFEGFRKSPDYFLHVNQENLDGYIENQLSSLEDAGEFVEDGGALIYMVPTMDKKETTSIISRFLEKHTEYQLEEQKQFLPFDKYDSVFYFAILRKALND